MLFKKYYTICFLLIILAASSARQYVFFRLSSISSKYKIEFQCCVPIFNELWHILDGPVEYNPFYIIYEDIYNILKVFTAPGWPLITSDFVKFVRAIILQYLSILSLHICSAIFCSNLIFLHITNIIPINGIFYQSTC